MSDDLISVVSAAVASSKDAPPDADAAAAIEGAGDIVGTRDADATSGVDAADAVAADTADPATTAPKSDESSPAAETPKPEESDDFSAVPERDANGRFNRIPHPRVKVMVERAAEKAAAPLRAELDTVKSHNTVYQERLTRVQEVEDIMFNDQPRFLEILKGIPGYAELLNSPVAGKAAPRTSDPSSEDIDFSHAPPPDAEGNYSPDGLQALLKWTIDQATTRATAVAEARLGKRYEPIEKTYEYQRKAEEQQRQLSNYVNASLEDGRKWRHFTENEGEILKALQQDSLAASKNGGKFKYRSLRDAYEDVVFGKLTTDRQKQREELLAEFERAPRATSAGGGRTAATPEPEQELTGMAAVEKAVRDSLRAHVGRA